MHLLVLSAFRHRTIRWRSRRSLGLNAPSGAQCFPTSTWLRGSKPSSRRVSMHLLVLSAFRQDSSGVEHVGRSGLNAPSGAQCFPTWKDGHGEEATLTSQCTFWCSVLSDPMVRGCGRRGPVCLNAPSGAQCFPTRRQMEDHGYGACSVSMHLLVLSAFRLEEYVAARRLPHPGSLNAPSGAQCFPTGEFGVEGIGELGLNAPSGAQCFPTPPPENRATTPFIGTKSPPTWKAPHRIGSHLSN